MFSEIYWNSLSVCPCISLSIHVLSEYKILVILFGELLVQFNPFPNKPLFLCVSSTSLLKTLWEKVKLLITSNFSFSHSVFSIRLESFPLFSSNLKLSSANSFSLEESKICRLGKGLLLLQ